MRSEWTDSKSKDLNAETKNIKRTSNACKDFKTRDQRRSTEVIDYSEHFESCFSEENVDAHPNMCWSLVGCHLGQRTMWTMGVQFTWIIVWRS